MPSSPADAKFWRALSSVALVVGIVGLLFDAAFGWWALIASGVLFAVELAVARFVAQPAGGERPG